MSAQRNQLLGRTDLLLLNEAVVIIDDEYKVVFTNPAAEKEYGRPSRGACCHKYIHGLDVPCWQVKGNRCPKKIMTEGSLKNYSTVHIHKTSAGEDYFLVSCSLLPEKGLLLQLHVKASGIIRELISHGILGEDDLRATFYEKLNFLVGKERFIKKLAERLKDKKVRFLSILDLRGLTFVNKFYGMVAGDLLIKTLEQVIFDMLRSRGGDDVFTQAAGDEFIILHAGSKKSQVQSLEQEILNRLSSTSLDYFDEKLSPKVSIGTLELKPDSDYSVDEVLKLLSHSKSLAKKSSDKRFFLATGSRQLKLIGEFKQTKSYAAKVQKAIAGNSVDLFFQPVVDMRSGEIHHLEALVRIADSDEYLPASAFIELIYELDLILQLDHLVFAKVMEFGPMIKKICPGILVNISPPSLKSRQFRKAFENTFTNLKKAGVELTVELTEQSFFDNFEIVKFIHQRFGTRFAIDDFGTGFSSFKTVAELSHEGVISALKIDGALIRDVNKSPNNLSVVTAIARMAEALDLKTIAEFIDSKKVLDRLIAIGVDLGQGYFFHKPAKISELTSQSVRSGIRKKFL
ncbi:MAG: EAL domain-containing protein [Candidatus Wallbacteria bacterium]|nr:EAL domain-containing protein [Candidatus Wallbacteria bacterium]